MIFSHFARSVASKAKGKFRPRHRTICYRWLLALGCWLAVSGAEAQGSCQTGACVFAGPRLASVDSSRGPLINALFTALLGSSVSVDVLDWNALAQGDLNLAGYLNLLQSELGVSSTDDVLTTDTTLATLTLVAAELVRNDGDTVLAEALDALSVPLAELTQTIALGDLLTLELPQGSLADIELSVLSLVTGLVQLYNYENVLTTPAPVSLSTADLGALGLGGVLRQAELYAQVVEPPIFICGGTGTRFYSAAVRLKLNLTLLELTPDSSGVVAALRSVLGPLGTVEATTRLTRLELYAAVARAEGVIGTIDAVQQALTVQATPGVADLYLGTLSDSVFRNRTLTNAQLLSNLGPAEIGTLALNLRVLGVINFQGTLGILARAHAFGEAPFADTLSFVPSYPQTQSAGSSSAVVAALLDDLIGSLELSLSGVTAVLQPYVNTILGALRPIVRNALVPVLRAILTGLVDPLLETLGVRIGEVDVTVSGLCQVCGLLSRIFTDLNQNGVFDAGEAWAGGAAGFARLLGDDGSSYTVPISPDTGVFEFTEVPPGTYTLLLTQTADAATPLAPPGFRFFVPESGSQSITLGDVPIAPTFALRVALAGRLTLLETVRNVSLGETTGVIQNSGRSGDTLEYCVTFVTTGDETLQDTVVNAPLSPYVSALPNNAAYGGQAVQLQFASAPPQYLSAAADGDAAEVSDGLVTVRLGDLAAGSSGVICFLTQISD